MRLWVKITAICVAVIMVIMSGCTFVILQMEENSLRRADETNAENSLVIYSQNVISSSVASRTDLKTETLLSIVTYYFRELTNLTQTETTFYSLM